MKELAKLRIKDADPRIKEVPIAELDEKINLIYSLGYVYNPYLKEFFNPFVNKGLKAIVVYNLDLDRIKILHEHFEQEFLNKHQKIREFEEIKKSIYKKSSVSNFIILFDTQSGIIGVVILITAIVLHIFGEIEFAAATLLVSFILINYYRIHNRLFAQNEGEWQLSPLWNKYQNLFQILSWALYPYMFYIYYVITDSIWLPILVIFFISYLIKKYIIQKLSNNYWRMTGVNCIRKFLEKKYI